MESVTVKLSAPVVDGENTITKLTFREPDIGDMLVSDKFKGDMEKMVAVLASISDMKLAVFKKIKTRDMARIMAATAELMGNDMAATTGDGPSE